MIRIYTQVAQGERWLEHYQGRRPLFACVLGFTKTGLIPGISAAGATPEDRQFTCLADAEFLYNGPVSCPQYRLPPLVAGASPVLISRAVVEGLALPLRLFNAGLAASLPVPAIDLGGTPAECLSSGKALELSTVQHLFKQGLHWGEALAAEREGSYLILGECVVGGTTTALALLIGLGIAAAGKVNSSHPQCNHQQKLAVVKTGFKKKAEARKLLTGEQENEEREEFFGVPSLFASPLEVVAAVGDPMQIVVAGMAIAASRTGGVMLAGGTQMLAVYALAEAMASHERLPWRPEHIVVGTTRWVAEDPTGDTVGLAKQVGTVPLLASQLCLTTSRYPQLRAYEQGYVKEGVGAGACAITAHLVRGWTQTQLLEAIEALAERYNNTGAEN